MLLGALSRLAFDFLCLLLLALSKHWVGVNTDLVRRAPLVLSLLAGMRSLPCKGTISHTVFSTPHAQQGPKRQLFAQLLTFNVEA